MYQPSSNRRIIKKNRRKRKITPRLFASYNYPDTVLLSYSCFVENNGFEPLTPCLQSRCSSQLS